MATERRASERSLALALTVVTAGLIAAAGCRQTVILDPSANGDGGGLPTGAAGSGPAGVGMAGSGTAGTNGFNQDAGLDLGLPGGPRFDGGRFEVFSLCPNGSGPLRILSAVPRTPDVIISVDRSTAMQAWWGAQSRLEAVELQVRGLLQQYDRSVRFGYEEFPSISGMCGSGQGCCAGSVTPPGQKSRNAIENMLDACDNGGQGCSQQGRPAADALQKINKIYTSFGGVTSAHSRYVVLVLGGDPSCGEPSGNGDPAMAACDAAKLEVQKLNALGIFTIVVGVGDDATSSATGGCLKDLALAGGLTSVRLAATPSALSDTLTNNVIVPMAQESCHLDVLEPPVDARNVSLFFDNDLVPPSPTDGWDFDQGTSLNKITVHGRWCDTLLHTSRVELVSGCVPPRR
jgi:hypothetical protein